MKRCTFVALLISCVSNVAAAQTSLPAIYVTPTSDGFETYIAAAISKKGVPAVVVDRPESAVYTLKPSQIQVHKETTGSKVMKCLFAYCADIDDKASTSVQLVDKKGVIVWSYAVNKGRGAKNQQSMAEAIAKHLKDEFFDSLSAARRTFATSGSNPSAPPLAAEPTTSAPVLSAPQTAVGSIPTVAAAYTVANGSTLAVNQHGDVADATFTYSNGAEYASARLQWNPRVSAFTGSGTIAIACGKATVDMPFMLQITVVDTTTIRERYSSPERVDCRTGEAKSCTSGEVVWMAGSSK